TKNYNKRNRHIVLSQGAEILYADSCILTLLEVKLELFFDKLYLSTDQAAKNKNTIEK
ncbi:17513_t:CDS:1, partial [Racocetra persica]